MTDTYVLVHTTMGRAAEVAREASELKEVDWAELVTGPYDVIVRARARSLEELQHGLLKQIDHFQGVIKTVACPVTHEDHW